MLQFVIVCALLTSIYPVIIMKTLRHIAIIALTISPLYAIANPFSPPIQDNKAYVLMDYDTGAILAQKNADTPLPMASLTKMMTSYILEQRLLDGTISEDTPIKISENAWCRGVSTQSCMYAELGSDVAAIDILRSIIIQSGNDASKAIAEHLAGSEQAFSIIMNEQAQKLGMSQTNFVNATGMPAVNHRSSAKDLAILSKAIIQDSKQYYPIYSEKQFTYNNITQQNRNTLLTDPSVDGLKTGHTNEAGFSLAVSSLKDDMRLIAIVLGAKSQKARADEAAQLLDFGFGHFTTKTLFESNQEIARAPILFGKSIDVLTKMGAPLKVLVAKTEQDKVQTRTEFLPELSAPIKSGEKIGQVVAYIDDTPIATAALVAAHDVDEVNFIVRIYRKLIGYIKNIF